MDKVYFYQAYVTSVYDGDTVYVEGYKDLFQVTLYDNNSLEYIPYL